MSEHGVRKVGLKNHRPGIAIAEANAPWGCFPMPLSVPSVPLVESEPVEDCGDFLPGARIPPVRLMRHSTDRDGVLGIVRCLVASRSSAKEMWVTISPPGGGWGEEDGVGYIDGRMCQFQPPPPPPSPEGGGS